MQNAFCLLFPPLILYSRIILVFFLSFLLTVCVPHAGSWSLQLEGGGTVCILHSLLWLGLTFFHVPQTPQHGHIYMGDRLMNLDLPFML